jgi:hypothetical protein
MNRRRALGVCGAVAVAVSVALGAVAALASVGFTSVVATSTAVSTGTVAPPSGVTAVATCKGKAGGGKGGPGGGGGGSAGSYVTVSWTASPSSFVSAYNVLRATSGGAPTVVATNVSGTTWTDTSIAGTTTYAYTVQSAYRGWTASSATPGTVTTAQAC